MRRRMLAAVVPLVVLWQLATSAAQSGRWRRDERGDVPGWVMIVVMTAAIVVVLTAVAKDQLKDMLSEALDSVTK